MELAEDLYREEILELYRNPLNYGKIKNADARFKDFNPVCGDDVEIFLVVKNDVLEQIKFEGKGCVISIAAASLLTEYLKGKKLNVAKNLKNEKMLSLLPIKIVDLRIKCALLALKCVKKAIIKCEVNPL